MNFAEILQLLSVIARILALLDESGKEKVVQTVAKTINGN